MRFTRILAPALLAAALAGCVDGPLSSIPAGDARVVVASGFSFSGMAAGLAIEEVRLTPRFVGEETGGPAGPVRTESVNSNADEFHVDAIVDLGDRDSATVVILVELISKASGEDVVEWSGEVGPLPVFANQTAEEHDIVNLTRGPIENRDVVFLSASGPSSMSVGQEHPAFANYETLGATPTVIWSSSDPSVIEVEPVTGDSVGLFALGSGEAWIFAGAGAQVDSFLVFVDDFQTGPIEDLTVIPDHVVMVPSSSRTLQAIASDSLGFIVPAVFEWTSLNTSVASVTSAGVVTAQAIGIAQIVVTTGAFADTALIEVQSIPAGIDVMFVGGAAADPFDWFTADNWTPARVPTATDVVFIPAGAFVDLDGNTTIGGFIGDSTGGYSINMNSSILTVDGDVIAPVLLGDSAARLVMTGNGATLTSIALPNTTIEADVSVVEQAYIYGDLELDDVLFDIGTAYVIVEGDFTAIDASVGLTRNDTTFDEGLLLVTGDALFDFGLFAGTIEAGTISIGGDFTVNGCDTFVPLGGDVQFVSDTSAINIACPSPTGNRFYDLNVYQQTTGVPRVLDLQSDVYVENELRIDGGEGTTVYGNGHTFRTRAGSVYYATFDHTFIEVAATAASDELFTDSILITGMTGEVRPQVRYEHPGIACTGCYGAVDVRFDPTSAGPYIEVIDVAANGDSVILYMEQNPGDGPARTLVAGEAAVYWADVPFHMFYWSGDNQTGSQHQPLPDSLVVEVVDYAFNGVEDATVDWTVTVGNGSVSPATSFTDADGFAATEFTLGDSIITSQQVIATSDDLPQDTVVFDEFPFFGAPPANGPARASTAERPVAPTPRPVPASRPLGERRTMPALPVRPNTPTSGRERP